MSELEDKKEIKCFVVGGVIGQDVGKFEECDECVVFDECFDKHYRKRNQDDEN